MTKRKLNGLIVCFRSRRSVNLRALKITGRRMVHKREKVVRIFTPTTNWPRHDRYSTDWWRRGVEVAEN